MLFKKNILIGTLIGFFSLPAFATLETYNHSGLPSTVKITSTGAPICSSILLGPKNGVTQPGEDKLTPDVLVRGACGATNPCTSLMYESNNCSGDPIAELALDQAHMVITKITTKNTKYKVTGLNTSRVDIYDVPSSSK